MPRRTITVGSQPSSFKFQDDFGPLNNGLAYAAGQWLASGRDRAQIEMQRDAQAQQADEREQDVGLRRLALNQQDQQRRDQETRYADELKQRKTRDDAEAGAKLRDDLGATGKYFLDWFRGGNPANAPKDGAVQGGGRWQSSRNSITGEAEYFRTAPDGSLETIDPKTGSVTRKGGTAPVVTSDALPQVVDQPPAVEPQPQPDEPGVMGRWWDNTKSGAQGLWELATGGNFTGEAATTPAGSLSDVALGTPAQPATPSIGSGQEQAQRQFMAGAGGWGMLMPSSIPSNNGTPPPPPAVVDNESLSKAGEFINATGINPDPSTGLTAEDFVSPDPDLRANALMKLPARERMKAIQALRAMGFN